MVTMVTKVKFENLLHYWHEHVVKLTQPQHNKVTFSRTAVADKDYYFFRDASALSI